MEVTTIKTLRKGGSSYEYTIDAADADKVAGYKWSHTSKSNESHYAVTWIGSGSDGGSAPLFLHRLINNTPKTKACIFVNGNSFDCRRDNLEAADFGRLSMKSRCRDVAMKYIRVQATSKGRLTYRVQIWDQTTDRINHVGAFYSLSEAKSKRDKAVKDQRARNAATVKDKK